MMANQPDIVGVEDRKTAIVLDVAIANDSNIRKRGREDPHAHRPVVEKSSLRDRPPAEERGECFTFYKISCGLLPSALT